jgi:S-adenosylmethionine decarboxylase
MDVQDVGYQFAGTHFLASYLQCDKDQLTDLKELKQAMFDAVKASGATMLDSVDYVFSPNGYTGAIILSESHATIHTYPEVDSCFVDLFTCGEKCSYVKFDEALRNYLKPGIVDFHVVKRSTDTQVSTMGKNRAH